MNEFNGQYYCQERNQYHLEYQGTHYYFDSIKEATNFMDKIKEDNMKKQTKKGLDNAPKIMQDFVVSLNNKEQAKKQFFILKHDSPIIKVLKHVYDLSVYFIIASIVVASMVESYYV